MNKNFAQQNAERRLRHCKWDTAREHSVPAALGFLLPIITIALLAFCMYGPEFFQ